MTALIWLAPLFLAFEIVQLIVAERYLGLAQIERDADPRDQPLGELPALLWLGAIVFYALWTLALLTLSASRLQALCLLAISIVGYLLRRNSSLAWTLVILTFEASLRIGMLLSLLAFFWPRR